MMLSEVFNRAWSFRVHPHLVFVMLTVLTGLFSSSPQAEEKKLRHHQINLSGNIFHFSMPEDFSRDMPAADIVESLDISDITKFDNPEYGNLIRDRKSTRLNSSHVKISYAVFCLKKKK